VFPRGVKTLRVRKEYERRDRVGDGLTLGGARPDFLLDEFEESPR
jgi:hypothetical protein